jgi:ATP-dependent Lon protease
VTLNDFGELHKKLCATSIEDLRQMLASAGMPPEVRKIADTALEALEALSTVSPGTSKHSNALAYVGYLASLPWNRTAENKPDIQDVEKILNENLHDPHAREKILKHLTGKLLNNHKKPKILVVDDERIALESLEYILNREDYTVVTARSGAEAIDKLKESDYDIVITDLIMGEVDGTAVVNETARNYPDTRVIMITGYATVDTAVQALRMGAFHYIEKPVRVDDLLSAVNDALRQKASTGKRKVLCLEGPSQEEQILAGKMIAGALGRKFSRIPLSELKDEPAISGLGRMTDGARPGRIIDEIRRVGSADPVLLLEGLDAAGRDFRGDFTSALMEALDPLKNRNFTDRYLDVPFDLSGIIFIVTANSSKNIQGPLRDILDIVKL